MKKKFMVYLCMCFFVLPVVFTPTLQAKKVASLKEIMKPRRMVVDENKLFLTEGTDIYIYSLKDFKLIKKFGKQGDGPQEFKTGPMGVPGLVLIPTHDQILINSEGKISYFTKNGEYRKEQKTPPFTVASPLKDKFISSGFIVNKNGQSSLCVNLLNSKCEKIKEIYISGIPAILGANFTLPYDPFRYIVYKDKIYVADASLDFSIAVFDKDGKELNRIKKDYQKLDIDDAYKDMMLKWVKNDSPFRQFWDMIKDKVKFKSTFPAIQDFVINADLIYVFSYKKQNDLTECIVLDLKGNEKKRVFLPLPFGVPPMSPLCYAIKDNRFYSLVENDETDSWDLDVAEIK